MSRVGGSGKALFGGGLLAVLAGTCCALFFYLPAGSAGAAGSYTAYAACSRTAESQPATECTVGDELGLFFRSDSAEVTYELCIDGPGGSHNCIAEQHAETGVLYVNNLTAGVSGFYTATWSVGGEVVASWSLKLREKEGGGAPPPSQPVGDPENCANPDSVRLCTVEYYVSIAGVALGDSRRQVIRALGPPLRVSRSFKNSICPREFSGQEAHELKVPVVRYTYVDHLTVSLQRLSRSANICSAENRTKGLAVTGVSTASSGDLFTNGIHVGSRLAAVRRAFQKYDMHCSFGEPGPAKNTCQVALKRPDWARDSSAIGYMQFRIKHRKVGSIALTLVRVLA